MKKLLIATMWAFALFFGFNASAQKIFTHKDSLTNLVKEYYRLNIKVFQAGSTVADIDEVFKLFTDDFTYIHPKYGGLYTREVLYKGYVRNQKGGGYNGHVTDIKVTNMIVGLNAVAVEKKFMNKGKKNKGQIKAGKPQMTLFEFKNGKIVKIFEYW